MKKVLIVVDMQKDFVDGTLGSPAAAAIVPAAAKKILESDHDAILVTLDTHDADYLQTLEGQKLPVPHCIKGTPGHALDHDIQLALEGKNYISVEKHTFGSFDVPQILAEKYPGEALEVELLGLCTDVCVISNALILRASFPDAKISVDARCCAGVTEETHQAALTAMKCCQIDVDEA
jgi:nicotinamidase/pyrazinamidase